MSGPEHIFPRSGMARPGGQSKEKLDMWTGRKRWATELAAHATAPATSGTATSRPARASHGIWNGSSTARGDGERRDQAGRDRQGDPGQRHHERLRSRQRSHRPGPGADGDEHVALVAALRGGERQPDRHDEQREHEHDPEDDSLERRQSTPRSHRPRRVPTIRKLGRPCRRRRGTTPPARFPRTSCSRHRAGPASTARRCARWRRTRRCRSRAGVPSPR